MKSHQNIKWTLRRCGNAEGRVAAVRSTSGDNESFQAFSSILHSISSAWLDLEWSDTKTYSSSLTCCKFGCLKSVPRPFLGRPRHVSNWTEV